METDKALSFLSCISSVSILTGISYQSSNLDSVLGVLASLTKTSKKDSRTFTDIEAECSLSYVVVGNPSLDAFGILLMTKTRSQCHYPFSTQPKSGRYEFDTRLATRCSKASLIITGICLIAIPSIEDLFSYDEYPFWEGEVLRAFNEILSTAMKHGDVLSFSTPVIQTIASRMPTHTGGYPLVTLGNLACQYTLVALKDSSCRGEGKETTTSDTKPRLKEKKNRQLSSRKRESTTTLICGFEPIGGSSNDRSVGQAASPESKSVDYNADQSNEIIPARHQARFSGSLITNRIGKKENGNPGVTEGYSDSSSEQKLILQLDCEQELKHVKAQSYWFCSVILYSSSFYSRVTFRADSEKEEAHEAVAATSSASSKIWSKDPNSLEDILRKGFSTGVSYINKWLPRNGKKHILFDLEVREGHRIQAWMGDHFGEVREGSETKKKKRQGQEDQKLILVRERRVEDGLSCSPKSSPILTLNVSSSSNSRGRPVTPSTYYELGSTHNINSKTPEKHI
uniref:Uncharacterized protein n=1 Tax=Salix viminalis TaxID=40686 RepID=A0A6N2N1X4_SALVM